MSLVAIDLSLRSAGLVRLTVEGTMMDFTVVQTKKEEFDDELLLLHVEKEVCAFIAKVNTDLPYDKVTAVVIEGLSFGSKSARSDLIAGNWWHVKAEIRRRWPDMMIGAIPVTSWRSKVINKELMKEYKAKFKTNHQKIAVVEHLKPHIRKTFETYIAREKFPKSTIYDLADAYWLGQYRLTKGSLTQCYQLPF